MDHLTVHHIVSLQVRNLERANSLDRRRESLIDAPTLFTPQTPSGGPQCSENLCAVESLALAVVTECHPSHSIRQGPDLSGRTLYDSGANRLC